MTRSGDRKRRAADRRTMEVSVHYHQHGEEWPVYVLKITELADGTCRIEQVEAEQGI